MEEKKEVRLNVVAPWKRDKTFDDSFSAAWKAPAKSVMKIIVIDDRLEQLIQAALQNSLCQFWNSKTPPGRFYNQI